MILVCYTISEKVDDPYTFVVFRISNILNVRSTLSSVIYYSFIYVVNSTTVYDSSF